MHSVVVRAQNVFGFFTTVAFIVGALIACSDFAAPRTPSASVDLKDVQVVKGRPHYYSVKKEEYAVIRFNLQADLSSLFNWNTKQVFVYVSASWPNATDTEVTNEAVIWDSIITNPSADHLVNIGPAAMKKLVKSAKGKKIDPSRGKLDLKNQKGKYTISSPTGKLANTDNVVLKLHYNVNPWVGILTWTPQIEFLKWKMIKGGVSKAFKFPALKVKKVEEKKKAAS
ncbi:signal peptidase subunit [Drepanopeziza brunnea f. sp. 'multigermtubi' MB_m1]|uniref:Signal peptidase subunit 3 n=1 Tax=Marssonina brunnea f. sp. multigermtubi (strain MB_m1) TaxID=1072389 RepID=K1X518_MARBU|nr:signal peptidase subunit [Drepanopeziza brunnea f. sp. 'multigermtubi' MB_m1]EKD20147.1 signal peptidase subunit [Drepanopeziza brunnea f. sp. 'multigermtubi' MB_m1]